MVNWHCISSINLPGTLTETQKGEFRSAWEVFQKQTILNRLKKAALVLLLCLLGFWVCFPTSHKDTLSPKIESELQQAKIQLENEEAQHAKKYEALVKQFEIKGVPPPLVHGVFGNTGLTEKIRLLEKDLEIAKRPQRPHATPLQKLLAIVLAVTLWLYLMAHTFDGGYNKSEKGESFAFRYLCSQKTLKNNLLELFWRLGDLLKTGGQMLRADMATQWGCVIGTAVLLVGVYLLSLAFLFVFSAFYLVALITMCGSTWLLLGWFIWSRPIKICWDRCKIQPPKEVTYLRGNELFEMPTASCSAPNQATPITPGDYLKGNVTLLDDGSYLIGSMMVDQASAFSGVNFNGVTISKEFGAGNDIKFEAEEEELRVRFTQGQWWKVA